MTGSSVGSKDVELSDGILAPSRRITRAGKVTSCSAVSSVSVAKRQREQMVLAVVACLLASTLAQHEGSSAAPYQIQPGTREASLASQRSTEAWWTDEQGLPNPSTEGQPELLPLGRTPCTRNLGTDLVDAAVPVRVAGASRDPSKASGLLSSSSPVDKKNPNVLDLITSSLSGALAKMNSSLSASAEGLRESTDAQPVEEGKSGLFPTVSPASPLLPDIDISSHLDGTPVLQTTLAYPSRDTFPNMTSGTAQPTATTDLTSARPPAPEGSPQGQKDLPGTSWPGTEISHTTHFDQKPTSHVGDVLPSAEMGFPTHQAVKEVSVSPEMLGRSVFPPTRPMGTVLPEATHVTTQVFYSSSGATARSFSESIRRVSTGALPTQSPELSSRSVASLQEAVLNGQGPGGTEPATRDPLGSTALPTALPQSSGWPLSGFSHAYATLPDFHTLVGSSETEGLATHNLAWHRSVPTSIGSPKADEAPTLSASTTGNPTTPEKDTEVPLSTTSPMETSETHYGVGEGTIPSVHDLATLAGKQTLGHSSTMLDFPGSEATVGYPVSLSGPHTPRTDSASSGGTAHSLEPGPTTHAPHSSPAVSPSAPFSLTSVPLERETAAETPTEAVLSAHYTTLGEGSTRLGSTSWGNLPASLGTTGEQDGFPTTKVMPSPSPGQGSSHECKGGIPLMAEPSTDVPGHVSVLSGQSEPMSLDVSSSFLSSDASSLLTFSVIPSRGVQTGYTTPLFHSRASSSTFEALPSADGTDSGSYREEMQPERLGGTQPMTALAGKIPESTSELPLATSGVPPSTDSSSSLTSAMFGVPPATSEVPLSTDSSSSLTSTMLGFPPATSAVALSTDSSSILTSTMLGVPHATSEVPLSMDSSSSLTLTMLGVPPATSGVPPSIDSSSSLISTMLGIPPATSAVAPSTDSSPSLTSTMRGVSPATSLVAPSTDSSSILTSTVLGVPPATSGVPPSTDSSSILTSTMLGVSPATSPVAPSTDSSSPLTSTMLGVPPVTSGVPPSMDSSSSLTSTVLRIPPTTSEVPLSTDASSNLTSTVLGVPSATSGVAPVTDSSSSLTSTMLGVPPATSGAPVSTGSSSNLTLTTLGVPPTTSGVPPSPDSSSILTSTMLGVPPATSAVASSTYSSFSLTSTMLGVPPTTSEVPLSTDASSNLTSTMLGVPSAASGVAPITDSSSSLTSTMLGVPPATSAAPVSTGASSNLTLTTLGVPPTTSGVPPSTDSSATLTSTMFGVPPATSGGPVSTGSSSNLTLTTLGVPPTTSGVLSSTDAPSKFTSTMLGVPPAISRVPLSTDGCSNLTSTTLGVPPTTSGVPPSTDSSATLTSIMFGVPPATSGAPVSTGSSSNLTLTTLAVPPTTSGVLSSTDSSSSLTSTMLGVPPAISRVPFSADGSSNLTSTTFVVPLTTSGVLPSTDSSSSLTSTMLGIAPTTSEVPLSTDASSNLTAEILGVPSATSGVPLSTDVSSSLTSTTLGVPPTTSEVPLSTDSSSSLTTVLGIPPETSRVSLPTDTSSNLTSIMLGVPPATSGVSLPTDASSNLTSITLGFSPSTSEGPPSTDSSSSLTSTMLGVPPATSGVALSMDSSSNLTSTMLGVLPVTSGVALSMDSSSNLTSTMLGVLPVTSGVAPITDSSFSLTSTMLGVPPASSAVTLSTDSSSHLTSTTFTVPSTTSRAALSMDSSSIFTSTMLGVPPATSGVALIMDSSSSLTSSVVEVSPATLGVTLPTDSFSSLTTTMLGIPPATSLVALSKDSSSTLASTMLGVPPATSGVSPSTDSSSSLTSTMLGVPPVTSRVPLSTDASSNLTLTILGVPHATSGVPPSTDSSSNLTSTMIGVASSTFGIPLSLDSSSSLISTMPGAPQASSGDPPSTDSFSSLSSTILGVPPATSGIALSMDSSSSLTSTTPGIPPTTSGVPLSTDSSSSLSSMMPGVPPAWTHFAFSKERTTSTPSPPWSSTFLTISGMAASKESSDPETLMVSSAPEGASSASVSTSTTRSNATLSSQFLDIAGVVQPFQTTPSGTQHVGTVTGSPPTSNGRELFSTAPSEWSLASPAPSQAVPHRTEMIGTSRPTDTTTDFFVRSTSSRSSSQTSAVLSHVETKPHTTQAMSPSSTTDPLASSRILPTASVWTLRAVCNDVHCLINTRPASLASLQRTSAELPVTSQTLPPKVLVTTPGSTVGKKGTTAGRSTKVNTPQLTYTTAVTSTEPGTITSSGPTSQQPVSAPRASTVSPTAEKDNITLSKRTLAVSILSLDFYLARIVYTESLANKSSVRYKKLEREVTLTLNKILSFYESFLQASVLRFLNGSVIAQTKAVFRGDGPVPTPSDMIRTIVTVVEQREIDASFDWRVDLKSLRCNGFNLKNLDPEVLAVSFTILGEGSVAAFGGLTDWGPLEGLRDEVVQSLGPRYQVQNFTLVQVRNIQGDLDINGEIYVNTAAHVDVSWALEALKGLANYSVHLGSLCINAILDTFLRGFSWQENDKGHEYGIKLNNVAAAKLLHTLRQYKNLLQVTIREVRGGSLLCYADMIFQPPAPTSQDLVHALALSVGPKNYLGASGIQVDPFSFTVAGTTREPPFAQPRIPGYGIALIVLCCLALIIIPLLALLYKHLGWKEKMVIHRFRDPELMVETFELDNPTFRPLTEENGQQTCSPTEALG